eukprot:4608126-Amphidinium_carterae.1
MFLSGRATCKYKADCSTHPALLCWNLHSTVAASAKVANDCERPEHVVHSAEAASTTPMDHWVQVLCCQLAHPFCDLAISRHAALQLPLISPVPSVRGVPTSRSSTETCTSEVHCSKVVHVRPAAPARARPKLGARAGH